MLSWNIEVFYQFFFLPVQCSKPKKGGKRFLDARENEPVLTYERIEA